MTRRVTSSFLIVFFSSFSFNGLSQDIRIDHAIVLVADLDSAVRAFEALGFTIKEGRLHNNGLLNAHIKFKNSTSIELMSVVSKPTDDMAKEYAKLLTHGEGGVYLALRGMKFSETAKILNQLKINYNLLTGQYWDYITFPENSSLAHIFFIDYHIALNETSEVLTHKNSAQGIEAVWIDGDAKVKELLAGVGIEQSSAVSDNHLGDGTKYALGTSAIVAIQKKESKERPRLAAISIRYRNSTEIIYLQ